MPLENGGKPLLKNQDSQTSPPSGERLNSVCRPNTWTIETSAATPTTNTSKLYDVGCLKTFSHDLYKHLHIYTNDCIISAWKVKSSSLLALVMMIW